MLLHFTFVLGGLIHHPWRRRRGVPPARGGPRPMPPWPSPLRGASGRLPSGWGFALWTETGRGVYGFLWQKPPSLLTMEPTSAAYRGIKPNTLYIYLLEHDDDVIYNRTDGTNTTIRSTSELLSTAVTENLDTAYPTTPRFLWHWPRTCCSRLRMTATAWCRISNLVWGLSLFRCIWHILPSSLNASLMSRTRRRSRALLAIRRSRSRSIFCSGDRSSSSLLLWWPMAGMSSNEGEKWEEEDGHVRTKAHHVPPWVEAGFNLQQSLTSLLHEVCVCVCEYTR